MVASLNNTNPARDAGVQQISVMRRNILFNTPGVATGVVIGTLPARAAIVWCHAHVKTTFNAATTNLVTVGTTGDSGIDNIIDAATAGSSFTETAGYGVAQPLAAFAQVLVDTEIRVAYNQTGTVATTGEADICISYVLNNDR